MSVVQTVLVFVGIPLGVLVVVGALVMAPAALQSGRSRYRPGRAWPYETAWWLPQTAGLAPAPGHAAIEAERASTMTAIASSATERADRAGADPATAAAIGERVAAERATTAVGGASGEW